MRLLLGVALLLGGVRVGTFVAAFARHSLQMDFSSFYTAAEALAHGLSPYVNNYRLGIWDGVDTAAHSRFLYPPLVAWLLLPLAALSYARAKLLWMLLALAALAASLVIAVLASDVDRRPEALLGTALVATLFYPLLTLLERGQIDTITLLLVIGAAAWLAAAPPGDGRAAWRQRGAGALLALATLLKLNIGYAALFLILRQRWQALGGFLAGALLLGLASLALVGPGLTFNYVQVQLPRIELYGEGGPGGLPSRDFASLLRGVPAGDTRQGGRVYPDAFFGFVSNATLVRALQPRFRHTSPSRLSLDLLLAFFGLMVAFEVLLRLRGAEPQGAAEFAYWNAVLAIVLLTGPLTWVMNVVWLLPVTAVLIGQQRLVRNGVQVGGLCLCALGLAWAALPDTGSFAMLLPTTLPLLHWKLLQDPWKYPAAELAVFSGLLLLLGADARRPPATAVAPGVWRLPLRGVNAYALESERGTVLVDAGNPGDGRRILALLREAGLPPPRQILLTHADVDHAGGARAIVRACDAEVLATPWDAALLSGRTGTGSLLRRLGRRLTGRVRCRGTLDDGRLVSGLRVIAAPGHTPGGCALLRESDGVLFCGDAASVGAGTVRIPPPPWTEDPPAARASVLRLAEWRPTLLLPGHGAALPDPETGLRSAAAGPQRRPTLRA